MNRIEKGSLLVLAIIVAFNIFFGLGSIPLLDPDEPVYAETAREMIQFNDYLSPRIYNEYWFDKPPMYYWLVAGAIHVFGETNFFPNSSKLLQSPSISSIFLICFNITAKVGYRYRNLRKFRKGCPKCTAK